MNFDSNFEVLLIRAAKKVAEKEVSEMMKTDTSESEITQREMLRFKQIVHSEKKRKRNFSLRVTLVACLIAVAIGFTACATIPQIRQKIKEIVIQLNEKYFSVSFDAVPDAGSNSVEDDIPFAQNSSTEQPQTTEEPQPITPPTKIEKKAYLSYLPGNYRPEVMLDTRKQYQVKYVNSEGEIIIKLTQSILTNETSWTDSEVNAEKIIINENIAFLTVKTIDGLSEYSLIWSDGYYQYVLCGRFNNQAEAVTVAQQIKFE